MNNDLAVTLICHVAGIAAFGFYFYATASTTQTNGDDCVAAATSIPLVNTTIGMGMTAAIAECKQKIHFVVRIINYAVPTMTYGTYAC